MRASRLGASLWLAALALAGCSGGGSAPISERIARDGAGREWLTYGGDYDEQRHSRLTGITPANVGKLGVAWTYQLSTNRGVEATPIIADGVMYVTSAWSVVHALDARTGRQLWVHDPQVPREKGADACCDVVNRGVAIDAGRVFVGTLDGRLQALDAKTGKLLWSTQTTDTSKPFTITGAPRVARGLVLIGNGGAELGVRGYLSAYDGATGKLAWRFYAVPNPDKKPDGAASDAIMAKLGNASWGDDGAWRTQGGGGTVWDAIVYDADNDQIIFGVGNGSPWNQMVRDPARRDNLFLSSIVAVDRATGAYKWHFQTTPGDRWDYTATQTLILANLPLGKDGAPRRAVMQAPKNGFFYVLDAKTGAYLSGDPFATLNWAEGLDANGRPRVVDAALYEKGPHLQLPGPLGAHNWQPMAFDPDRKLVFIPAQEIPQAYTADPRAGSQPARWNTDVDFAAGIVPDLPPGAIQGLRAALKGRLVAWDPIARKPRWTVDYPTAWNGGIMTTASGLVFQGQLDGHLNAFSADDGKKLWSVALGAGIAAPPVTYEIDGEQYLAVATGWGSAFALVNGFMFDDGLPSTLGRVVVFKLGATGKPPALELASINRMPQAPAFGTPAQVQTGLVAFSRNCAVCHGVFAVSSGVLPDLRWSAYTANAGAWQKVVRGGALSKQGMVAFDKQLSAEDVEAIRAYVVDQAHKGAKPPKS